MLRLPFWNLTSKTASVHDLESGTAVQMVAKLYGVVDSLIEEFNVLADATEKKVNDLKFEYNSKLDDFKTCYEHRFDMHREAIATMIKKQDAKIEATKQYMNDNIYATAKNVVDEMIDEGEIVIGFTYNEGDESLTLDVH